MVSLGDQVIHMFTADGRPAPDNTESGAKLFFKFDKWLIGAAGADKSQASTKFPTYQMIKKKLCEQLGKHTRTCWLVDASGQPIHGCCSASEVSMK